VPGVALDAFALDDAALAVLLDTERRLRERGHDAVIVAGSTRDPDTGEVTYGAWSGPTAGGRCGASSSSPATRRAPATR
jgi:hypothetical protein